MCFSVCSVCSLDIMAQVYANCAPGARVCSSKGTYFKTNTFCTLCVHTRALCAHGYAISFMMSTLTFFKYSMPSKLEYNMSSCVSRHIDFTPTFFSSLGTGPRWYNKHKTRLLLASRRHDRSRTAKTKETLQMACGAAHGRGQRLQER